MAKLILSSSASRWKNSKISQYPDIRAFIEKLESMVREKPERGLKDAELSVNGKTIPCYKHSVNISLFPHRNAIGYGFITANYTYNKSIVYIVKMNFA